MTNEFDDETIDDASEVINKVTRRYKRKYWWADEKELQQEAWVAVLKAIPNWDPRFGDNSMDRYLWNAANYALRPFVWKQLSVLSAPMQELSELFKHQYPVDIDDIVEGGSDAHAGDELDSKRWDSEAAKLLGEVFDRIKDGHLAAACLISERKPADVAKEFSVPVSRAYRATEQAKKAIGRDYSLFKLWKAKHQLQLR